MKKPSRGTTPEEAPIFETMFNLGLSYNCTVANCGSCWCSKEIKGHSVCDWCYKMDRKQLMATDDWWIDEGA